jgi:AAA+ ATPase superfamily predicted ATPase
MDFVDRVEELGRLQAVTRGRESALVVVWGRRRVGKTRLLLEWVRASGGVYWVADESAAPIQRRNLAETMEVRLPGFGQVDYRDWGTLLARLAREALAARWRGPLVLDEAPYLVGASPELPAVLQRFIDHDAREAGLVVALAGSSQRMMQGLTLDPGAPLYGRARELMKLRPIPAGYVGEAFGQTSAAKSAEIYALWGGVPRYWELASAFRDPREAADALALSPLGPLHDEPTRLLLEESPPAIALRPVLDAIGAGAHRVSEIAARIGQPATSLARPLARLQELDLATRETPFGEPERSSKRALYKLGDPFLRLWFSLIAPKRSLLLQVPSKARLRLFDQAFPRLAAATWEELCRQAVPLLAERLGGVEHGPARRYWAGGGPEWDVVAEAVDGSALLVGEAKWIAGEPSAAVVEQAIRGLLAKGAPPGARRAGAEVHHALFMSRLPRGKARRASSHVRLIDAGDVLGALR